MKRNVTVPNVQSDYPLSRRCVTFVQHDDSKRSLLWASLHDLTFTTTKIAEAARTLSRRVLPVSCGVRGKDKIGDGVDGRCFNPAG